MAGTPRAPMPSGNRRRAVVRDGALLTLAALAFLLAAGWRLSLPGLQYDECLAAAPAVNFVRGVENAEPMLLRPSVIRPFGHPLPVMVMPYIGPVKTLLHAPFFALFGISTVTVRLLPLTAGLASLVLTWWICRRLWGRRVAHLAVALVALDPSWVFYLTRDVGPAALAVLFKLAAVALGIRWWRDGGGWSLAGAGFLLGLGVSHKVDFLWVVAALAVPLAVLAPRELGSRLRGWSPVTGGVALLAGAAPVVAFNLATGGHTFGPFLERLLVSERGRFLGGFFEHLGTRLEQVAGLLNGQAVDRLFFAEPRPGAWGGVVPAVLVASLVGLAVFTLRPLFQRSSSRRPSSSFSPTLGLLLHLVVFLAASCFSPTILQPHHLLALYPALHVAMALALVELMRWSRFLGQGPPRGAVTAVRGTALGVAALGVTAVLAANVTAVAAIHGALRETGGVGAWSDAVGELAEDLEKRDEAEPVVVLDWGFTNNLIVLTEGEVPLEPAYRELWRHPPAPELFMPHLGPGRLYLLHAPPFTRLQEAPELFRRAVAEHGLRPVVETRFEQRNGREIYRLVRLVRAEGTP